MATTELVLEVHVTVAALVIPAQVAMTPSSALIQFPGTAVQQVIVSTARHVSPAQSMLSAPVLAFQFNCKKLRICKRKFKKKKKEEVLESTDRQKNRKKMS